MPELLHAYDPRGNILKTVAKRKLLREQREHSFAQGDSPFALEVVYLLLRHPENGVYVAQRARKRENPYFWGNPISGHVSVGETPDETLIREAKEEGGIEVHIIAAHEEYDARIKEDSLESRALVRKIDFMPWFGSYRIDRITKKPWQKRTRAHIYAGEYRGNIMCDGTIDGDDFGDGKHEILAVRIYQKEELERLIGSENPNEPPFTHDLAIFFKRYQAFL